MEKIKTTLHPKDSPNDELYPNVLPSNIPVSQGLINTGDELSIDNTYVQEKLTTGVGINIDENKISIADSVSKQVEFTQGVKTSKIVDTNGYSYLTSDTSYINVGNSSRLLQTYGSGSRPTYNGKDLALLSDSDTSHWNMLMDTLGVGRWANQTFVGIETWAPESEKNNFHDLLAPYYTNLIRYWAYGKFDTDRDINFVYDFKTSEYINVQYMFYNCSQKVAIYLPNMCVQGPYMFQSSAFTKILIKENCTVKCDACNIVGMFRYCPNLVEIGAFDFSNVNGYQATFEKDINLKSIHATGFKASFNISYSTAFEESDLVEILNNLDIVSTTQTLTIGTTNLAKLTTDDILIATGKGWQLA